MATRKKTKGKSTKKAKGKSGSATRRAKAPARKAAPRRRAVRKTPQRKKTSARRAPAKRTAARRPAAARPAPARLPIPADRPPPGERVGVVTHYYTDLSVAIVKLESGSLRVGDGIHVRGHTSDFAQRVDSLQVDHASVQEVRHGDEFGVKVREHAREHDVVYKTS